MNRRAVTIDEDTLIQLYLGFEVLKEHFEVANIQLGFDIANENMQMLRQAYAPVSLLAEKRKNELREMVKRDE